MSHTLHVTPAFVLATRNVAESSRVIALMTKDFGCLDARAQGIRELKSKLRYVLQRSFYVRISLVRGREFWRVVSAEEIFDFPRLRSDIDKHNLYARMLALINRFGGEIHDRTLFEELEESVRFLDREVVDSRELRRFEILFALRFMHRLGYVGKEGVSPEGVVPDPLVTSAGGTKETLARLGDYENAAVAIINESIKVSHL